MPPLSGDEYAALREDIRLHGQQVPIIVDEDGNVLDGNNRAEICLELGIEPRTEVRAGLTEDQKWNLALRLNNNRRHMLPEQKRQLIRDELTRDKSRSDRYVASLLGVDPRTVERQRHAMFPEEFPAPDMDAVVAELGERLAQMELDRSNDNWAIADSVFAAVPPETEAAAAEELKMHGQIERPGYDTPEYEALVVKASDAVNRVVASVVRECNLIAGFAEQHFADTPASLSALGEYIDAAALVMEVTEWMQEHDVRQAYVRCAPWLTLLDRAESGTVAR
jgi:hypothetical protein